MKQDLVVHSNALITSVHRMTTTEIKLMYYCTTLVRRDGDYSDGNRHFEIYAQDFSRIMGLNETYRQIKTAALKLQQRIVMITEQIIDKEGKVWDGEAISVLSAQKWKENEGCIKLSFAPEFMPYLTKLSGHHTKLFLSDIKGMKSNYAIRFYSMVRKHFNQHQSNKQPPRLVIKVDEMRRMFELEQKYKAHKDFKKRVIDVGINEINAHSPLSVSYTQIKKGRRIDAYSFKVEEKAMTIKASSKAAKKIEKTIESIKKALSNGRIVSINSKRLIEVSGAIASFENGAENLYVLLKSGAEVEIKQADELF